MDKQLLINLLLILFCSADIYAQYNPLVASRENPLSDFPEVYNSDQIFQPKNENTASLLSILIPAATITTGVIISKNDYTTDIGVILTSLGIIIGPSAGNMYAQNPESVMKGIGTRLLGSGMALLGGYFIIANAISSALGGSNYNTISAGGTLMFVGGTALILYSTIYDIFNAPLNVKKYNKNKGPNYVLSPVYYTEYQVLGAAISIRF